MRAVAKQGKRCVKENNCKIKGKKEARIDQKTTASDEPNTYHKLLENRVDHIVDLLEVREDPVDIHTEVVDNEDDRDNVEEGTCVRGAADT